MYKYKKQYEMYNKIISVWISTAYLSKLQSKRVISNDTKVVTVCANCTSCTESQYLLSFDYSLTNTFS